MWNPRIQTASGPKRAKYSAFALVLFLFSCFLAFWYLVGASTESGQLVEWIDPIFIGLLVLSFACMILTFFGVRLAFWVVVGISALLVILPFLPLQYLGAPL